MLSSFRRVPVVLLLVFVEVESADPRYIWSMVGKRGVHMRDRRLESYPKSLIDRVSNTSMEMKIHVDTSDQSHRPIDGRRRGLITFRCQKCWQRS